LQALGKEIGWGFQFQYPGFVIVMTAICFALGLSLAGVFELTFTVPRKGLTLAQREGMGGAFFQGVLATVLATPCTAPLLGVTLGFAFSSPLLVLYLVFFVMGMGMAFPYLLLAANPDWLRWIPKPGHWMENFKQGMSFLLFATCIWLLWVLGRQVGLDGLVWTLAFLVALGLACWVYGKIQFFSFFQRLIGVVLILLFLFSTSHYFIRPLFVLSKPAEKTEIQKQTIPWKKFDAATFEKVLADGKRVFLDFTADWCLTCKVNEKVVLQEPAIVQKFKDLSIVAFKLDWTNQDPEVTRRLKEYGRFGVPLYVYFPQGNQQPPKILPEVLTKNLLLKYLEERK